MNEFYEEIVRIPYGTKQFFLAIKSIFQFYKYFYVFFFIKTFSHDKFISYDSPPLHQNTHISKAGATISNILI